MSSDATENAEIAASETARRHANRRECRSFCEVPHMSKPRHGQPQIEFTIEQTKALSQYFDHTTVVRRRPVLAWASCAI